MVVLAAAAALVEASESAAVAAAVKMSELAAAGEVRPAAVAPAVCKGSPTCWEGVVAIVAGAAEAAAVPG